MPQTLPLPPIPKLPAPPAEMMKLPGVQKYASDMAQWHLQLEDWRKKTSKVLGLPIDQ